MAIGDSAEVLGTINLKAEGGDAVVPVAKLTCHDRDAFQCASEYFLLLSGCLLKK